MDETIVAAARELFIEGGLPGVSIEAVAGRAGVTRASVYRRYADRDALLLASVESIRIEQDPEDLDGPSVEAMVRDWARVLSSPANRSLVRRLYGPSMTIRDC